MKIKGEFPLRLNRRRFLQVTLTATGGLLVSFALPALQLSGKAASAEQADPFRAWLRISPDGTITVMVPNSEMGQGVATSLPMLIAEQLEVDWNAVRIEFPPSDPAYDNPMFGVQGTGGSTSIRAFFTPLRQLGAAAREMLRKAAANEWGVPVAECEAADGHISHPSGKGASYGTLVAAAAKLPVLGDIALKPRSEWKLLGKPRARLDTPAKVDGSAGFGADVRVPGMLVGTVAMSSVLGGTLKEVDEKPALAVRGVRTVVKLPNAVAVVGDGYWQAKKGLTA